VRTYKHTHTHTHTHIHTNITVVAGFKVLTGVTMMSAILSDAMLCGPISEFLRLGDVISQKMALFSTLVLRTIHTK
jgi:hypothetical protein